MTTTTRIAAIIEHTPGPWAIRHTPRCHSAPPFLEILSGPTVIGELFNDQTNYDNEPTGGEGEANARLVAAAPELLTAVELAYEIMDAQFDGEFPECMQQIRAAITKARGPQ